MKKKREGRKWKEKYLLAKLEKNGVPFEFEAKSAPGGTTKHKDGDWDYRGME